MNISDEKVEMLGKVLAVTFNLKKNKRGYFSTKYQGEKTYKGIANIVLATIEDTINESEDSLRNQMRTNFTPPLI